MLILGIDHVQLAAPPDCEAQARRFFGELLGLEEIEKPESLRERCGVWFTLGSQQLHIGVQDPFLPARKAHPAFRVTDEALDLLAATLVQAGELIEWDDALPQTRRFYAADPWGNRIEVIAPREAR
jgi:catechol 2,3-dioxygenase-like lactoylglutathione lyase family enzyme